MCGKVRNLMSFKSKFRTQKVHPILFHHNIIGFKKDRDFSKIRNGKIREMQRAKGRRELKNKSYIWAPQKMVKIIPILATSKTLQSRMILNPRGSAQGISKNFNKSG